MPITFPFTIHTPGNYPGDVSSQPSLPDDADRIILASDVRGFTLSMEEHQKKVILFVSEFFDDVSRLIQDRVSGAFVNKYLGDGILAHFPNVPNSSDAAANAVETAFLSLTCFQNYATKKFGFQKVGLSTVLSRERIFIGSVGKSHYIDYTLLGKHVNRVFRALGSAKGNLVLVFENLKDFLNEMYLLVDIGLQTYDGVYTPVELYSVMRKKEDDESDKKLRLCVEQCSGYAICRNAWDRGHDKKKFLNCQECGRGKCWNWKYCGIKNDYGIENKGHDGFECCHICTYFVRCFHNYYLGRSFSLGKQIPMIWCGDPSLPFRFGTDIPPL